MNEKLKYIQCRTTVGDVYIVARGQKIVAVHIGEEDLNKEENRENLLYDDQAPLLKEAKSQMEEYFSAKRKSFELPLEEKGTPFQISVWDKLKNIPYGETKSYQEIAEEIGNSNAVRAIGQANKANKLPIIIPCHRVIGKNKSLTGYAGKRTDIKEKLLSLEGSFYRK